MPYHVFGHYAKRYDSWYDRHPVTAENEARLVEEAAKEHPVAEIGAGTGFFASRVSAEAAIDPSLPMLLEGKKRRRNRIYEPINAVGERLPLRPGSIRTALLVVTLCFLDEPLTVLLEAKEALKNGGKIVACIVPRNSPWGRYYMKKAERGHPLYRYARFYTVKETIQLLDKAGYREPTISATITYRPWEPPKLEEPRHDTALEEAEKMGFTCISMKKR